MSYAYIIDMYCIPLLLVTGESPVKYVYIFPLSVFDSPIAENTQILFSSLWGGGSVSISSANCSLFVDLGFFLFDQNVPKQLLLILSGLQQLILQLGLAMFQIFHSLQP